MLVTRAGDLGLEIAARLSVCLSVWAVRDVSTPWPTEESVRRLLLTGAAGRLLSRGWLGGCELSELHTCTPHTVRLSDGRTLRVTDLLAVSSLLGCWDQPRKLHVCPGRYVCAAARES